MLSPFCTTGYPVSVHSDYIAKVVRWDEEISATDIVRGGRLGGKVKKQTLLCTVNPGDGTVHYLTLSFSSTRNSNS